MSQREPTALEGLRPLGQMLRQIASRLHHTAKHDVSGTSGVFFPSSDVREEKNKPVKTFLKELKTDVSEALKRPFTLVHIN